MTRRIWVGLVMIGLAACSGVDKRTDYDPGADFSTYHTYEWVTDELMVQPPEGADPRVSALVQQRIRDAIDQSLARKGFRQEQSGDFAVGFTVGLRDRERVSNWGPYGSSYRPYGSYDPYRGPYGARTTVTSYTQGTLAIDMFDVQTRRPIWHGRATKIVQDSDDRPEVIQEIVDSVLADFPPQ
jgi:hypothetical protein